MPLNNQTIKGLIAEEVFKFHIKRAGFNIFNNIIAKLPDFMIWRDSQTSDDIEYKFVGVKFRAKLDSKVFVPTVDRGCKHLF